MRYRKVLFASTVHSSPSNACLGNYKENTVFTAYEREITLAKLAMQCRNFQMSFSWLERAHVLAQRSTTRHCYVHWLMLVVGWRQSDYREVVGQLPRIFAAAMFSKVWVPLGNTGRARISAFRPMPVPPDLRRWFSPGGRSDL
jgi:hypothetical protein